MCNAVADTVQHRPLGSLQIGPPHQHHHKMRKLGPFSYHFATITNRANAHKQTVAMCIPTVIAPEA
jgi:hypothetical protein